MSCLDWPGRSRGRSPTSTPTGQASKCDTHTYICVFVCKITKKKPTKYTSTNSTTCHHKLVPSLKFFFWMNCYIFLFIYLLFDGLIDWLIDWLGHVIQHIISINMALFIRFTPRLRVIVFWVLLFMLSQVPMWRQRRAVAKENQNRGEGAVHLWNFFFQFFSKLCFLFEFHSICRHCFCPLALEKKLNKQKRAPGGRKRSALKHKAASEWGSLSTLRPSEWILSTQPVGPRWWKTRGGSDATPLLPLQENFFDIQEALQAIHMRQEMLREQLACAKSKGEETVGRNLQVEASRTLCGCGWRDKRWWAGHHVKSNLRKWEDHTFGRTFDLI